MNQKRLQLVVKLEGFTNLSGQSLVEVVVALGVVVVLAIALVSSSLVTQKTSRSAAATSQATKLVQQNIEQIRVFRDRQGFGFLDNNNCWVLVTPDPDPLKWRLANTVPNTCPESIILGQTTFNRSVRIEAVAVNANQKRIKVTVTWADSGGVQTVSNTTVLSNCVTTSVAC